MGHVEKLPWELIEEILSRVEPKSLARFRIVSKRWNALFDDKTFVNNHKMTFRFIIATKHKIYSVSIDPVIVVRELLTLGTPGLESLRLRNLVDCNELLLCGKKKGAVVWNPWLGQSGWIKKSPKRSIMEFYGTVYENKKYKLVGMSYVKEDHPGSWKIYDLSSHVWIEYKLEAGGETAFYAEPAVSLNGTLYLVCFSGETDPLCYYICKFHFWSEAWEFFCCLPCGRNHVEDALVLRAFRGDRFALLKQCIVTKKIEIWVTENKIIDYEDGGDVVWMNFMTFSSPNLPDLVETPSYFIEDKRLVVCSCDNTGQAWIYILGDDKLISKTRLDYEADPWPLHCTFVPSLAPLFSV